MYFSWPKFFFALALVMSFIASAKAVSPQTYDEEHLSASDYVSLFHQIDENIYTYNQINDSLFVKSTKEEWVETYLNRARQTYQLGQETQQLVDRLFNGMKRDVQNGRFDSVLHDPNVNLMPNIKDDFLHEEIVQFYYDQLYKSKDNSTLCMESFMYITFNLAAVKQVTSVSGDSAAFDQCFHLLMDLMEHYVPGRDVPKTEKTVLVFMNAYEYIITHKEFIMHGLATVEDYNSWRVAFEGFLNDPTFDRLLPESRKKVYRTTLAQYELAMLRNVYLIDTTHFYDQIRDTLLTRQVDYYDQHPELEAKFNISSQRRMVVMRQALGRISAIEAIKLGESICEGLSADLSSELQLSVKLSTILECVYFVDISDLGYAEKRSYIKKYCNQILSDLAHSPYDNMMPNMVRTMAHVATYPRIHRYLNTAERKEFLETLLFYSQPFTRAHSETVARLALLIFDGVIEQRPDLLTGMLGYQTADEVKHDSQRLKDFFTDAARYHDLGKTRMPDIIRNEYRKLTDHEFSIIRHHSELGLDYLKVDSTLMALSDIVIGHHKWYNNKGGYPASFNKSESPYSVLIDILTLADCLEAATSRLGRNYRKNKHYDDVLKEFQTDAGTRYSPELVKILETHPTLGNQLRQFCEKGWEDVYYRVFNMVE